MMTTRVKTLTLVAILLLEMVGRVNVVQRRMSPLMAERLPAQEHSRLYHRFAFRADSIIEFPPLLFFSTIIFVTINLMCFLLNVIFAISSRSVITSN